MRIEPIHKKLSTSFVDVGKLIKHLYHYHFVGRIHIEFSDYEAEVIFRPGRSVHVRQFDHQTKTFDNGEKALKDLLARSREPHGQVNVFEYIFKERPARVYVDEHISASARRMAYSRTDTNASEIISSQRQRDEISRMRDRAELKELILELLKNAEMAFIAQRLDFERIFSNACSLVAERYPFVDPTKKEFEFADSRLYVSERISATQLANAISAILLHMFCKLQQSAELKKLLGFTTHRFRTVISRRRALIDRMLLTRQFEKLADY
ncbi:hypothetical protein [Leptolyngbya sp. 7M]|uniref:hypothetical protein n=1 Tax=Leptolyngbya sp. 7M TaxID=2812896 RepID=UPI001B8B8120|nr:hypothetical protein [Leptolyngbya sp. 7M]QYO65407.1 hypothetical protein JVX88_01075 [Leptolyngbya sp. 7M]